MSILPLTMASLLLAATGSPAEPPHGPEIEARLGAVKAYLDEPFQLEVGAAFLFPLGNRLALGPDLSYSPGDRFPAWSAGALARFALGRPGAPVAWRLIGSIGARTESDQAIPGYSATELSLAGGVGVRIRLAEGVSISPEVLLGSHQVPQVRAAVAWRIGG